MSNLKNENVKNLLSTISDYCNSSEENSSKIFNKQKNAQLAITQLESLLMGRIKGKSDNDAKCTQQIPTLFGEVGSIPPTGE